MNFINQAISVIHESCTEQGFVAAPYNTDNYQRIWSRDSAMTGIAALLIDDSKAIKTFRNSILTLCNHQLASGQIPSNVGFEANGQISISYGTLSGKVDATTWWIISACLYIEHCHDADLKLFFEKKIHLAFQILKAWEYNSKHLLYTPIGGNWADEYLCEAYTLYDNCLYYWALTLAANLYNHDGLMEKSNYVRNAIIDNFNPGNSEHVIHKTAHQNLIDSDYLPSSFSPKGYNSYWDMAGNAFALLLGLHNKPYKLLNYISQLATKQNNYLLPVFYPIINESDPDYRLLQMHHLYQFKNKPYHFHNGGSWPIFLAWLSMACRLNNHTTISSAINQEYNNHLSALNNVDFAFYEYINTKDFKPGGVKNLCFSASGYIYMNATMQLSSSDIKKILHL